MADDAELKLDKEAFNALVKEVVDTECVPRMQRVADACNASFGRHRAENDYRVSVEGDKPLTKHDYRATVITATGDAMRDNMKNNTLIQKFHIAGGD